MFYIVTCILLLLLVRYYVCKRNGNNSIRTQLIEYFKSARLGDHPVTPDQVSSHDYLISEGRVVKAHKALPTYFKWREKLLVPIRDQGRCASCWAFAVADCLADRLSIQTGGKVSRNLSVQELLSCFNKTLFHCKRGGIPELSYKYVIANGLYAEEDYPYEQMVNNEIIGDCKSKASFWNYLYSSADRAERNTEKVYGLEGSAKNLCFNLSSLSKTSEKYQKYLEQNISNMKAEIYLHGPIVGTLYVHRDLYKYDGRSVYEHDANSPQMGGHAIEIFGWSDKGANTNEPGFEGAYWICRNSWGLKWPQNLPYGLMYIRMGTNESGIESRASSIMPKLNKYTRSYETSFRRENLNYSSYQEYINDPDRVNFIAKDTQQEKLI